MSRFGRRAWIGAGTLCAAVWLTSAPRAAPSEPSAAELASARDFLREGRELRAQNDHEGALKKFLAAYAIVPTPVTGLPVAEEQIALGQLVEARVTLGAIGRMKPPPDESEVGRQARETASTLLANLVPRIPVLEVKVTGAVSGKQPTLTIDDRAVPALSAEQGLRVNPGAHTVVAKLAGKPDQTQTIEINENERRTIELVFPPGDTDATDESVPDASSPKRDEAPSARGPLSTIGLVGAGAGLVTIGVGSLLALSAKSSYSEARDAHCDSDGCTIEGKQLTDDARSRARTSTVIVGIGAAIMAAGVVVWLTAPSGGSEPKTGITTLNVGLGSLAIGGRF
jgi:hypothetical protein